MISGLPLHHVGIVLSGEDDVQTLMAVLGMEEDYRGYVPQWRALCIFAKADRGAVIEFVVPNGGPLERFNKGAGGVHHVAFAVPDIAQTMRAYEAKGMKFLEKEAIKGAGPFLCNFLSPVTTRGVMIEFVQPF
ncbi:VOC family protein [Roseiarcus sp.]|uniref:VOC family protein n=1 Tax=Roseiarcus sp. TaxID=1969460 RepID=UPI003F957402